MHIYIKLYNFFPSLKKITNIKSIKNIILESDRECDKMSIEITENIKTTSKF
jgi:hypothetical protein